MLILPIRTESVTRRTPGANYLLIAVNVLAYLVFRLPVFRDVLGPFEDRVLTFHSDEPAIHQFLTYQFLHADLGHLFGNLLFLWVFGNGVNGKLGDGPYLLFYLAGGVFAAWGNAVVTETPFQLLGASGSIAAVTTAYLALFPRSHITVLVWFFFFLHFFELPAMVVIGLKIIVWDNIVAPRIGDAGHIAHAAHLSGYFFGFLGALTLLFSRAVARDHFDILALWQRWYRRREYATVASGPGRKAWGQYGSVARPAFRTPEEQEEAERVLDEIALLRTNILDALERGPAEVVVADNERLSQLDPRQCLSERPQLELGRCLYSVGKLQPAVAAFERFIECYPQSIHAGEVLLLLGILYARELQQWELAGKHLRAAMALLRDERRLSQCAEWLSKVQANSVPPVAD